MERAQSERKDALADARMILSDEPLKNFGVERYKLAEYGDCTGDKGCYWADLDAQYRRAETELAKELAAKTQDKKLAIVMDIDETTLTNYCEMRREDFGFIGPMYHAWETSPEAAMAIPGALRLFHEARAAGVDVFFITGRGGIPDYSAATQAPDETQATARNLETAGFHGWAGLQLRNGGERLEPTIDYKSGERVRIVAKGYRLLLSIGDQWSDLLGDPRADVSVKLPNPFYFIP
jgi:predicted secreted acid phosphatase